MLTHDGRRIIVQDGSFMLRCYDVDTGEMQWNRKVETWSNRSHISLSADDSLLALSHGYSLQYRQPSVIMDTMSGETVFSWANGVIESSLYPDGTRVAQWRVADDPVRVLLEVVDVRLGSVCRLFKQQPANEEHFEHGVDDHVFSPCFFGVEVVSINNDDGCWWQCVCVVMRSW